MTSPIPESEPFLSAIEILLFEVLVELWFFIKMMFGLNMTNSAGLTAHNQRMGLSSQGVKRTPLRNSPEVTPVAQNMTSP